MLSLLHGWVYIFPGQQIILLTFHNYMLTIGVLKQVLISFSTFSNNCSFFFEPRKSEVIVKRKIDLKCLLLIHFQILRDV
jgi:hypothetical protein